MPFAKEMSCSFLQAQSIILSISPMTLSPGQFSGDLRGRIEVNIWPVSQKSF